MGRMQWDLFCRVVDNFGDIGVCWRLAADLASRGEQVRLWVDDTSALRWMAPEGAPGVHVLAWPAADTAVEPGEVAIEAFGCDLPPAFVGRMARAPRPPLWIDLEYLSAEGFVERAHGLPSPQSSGPGSGLTKWFFYPGFTPRTGGLIRETALLARQRAFDAPSWLAAQGAQAAGGEQIVSLFCYEATALPALVALLSQRPTLLLATAGAATHQMAALLGPSLRRGGLRALPLPSLTQFEYDHLLWASDLNFVRGEDSFVRAQWAGKPFVWQIYPQGDGAHLDKLDAFLGRFLAGADDRCAADLRRLWQAWNAGDAALAALPEPSRWREQCESWRATLLAQADLGTQLIGFARETR
jgi:uncharacterized repeat protein (TIGR03837 family)